MLYVYFSVHLGGRVQGVAVAHACIWLKHRATNIPVLLQSHHHHAEHSFSRKDVFTFGPQPSSWRIQQHNMHKTQSANRFKVIKETVAAVIWGFISFLLWGMAGSRSHFAKLFFCGVITSLSIWSMSSLRYERWSEKGLERDESPERRGDKGQHRIKKKKHERIWKVVLQSLLSHSADIGEIRKAQSPCVCARAILPKQSTK